MSELEDERYICFTAPKDCADKIKYGDAFCIRARQTTGMVTWKG